MYLTRRRPLSWGGFVVNDPLNALVAQAVTAPMGGTTVRLPVDIRETEDAYVIEASVPGFEPEQVQVTVDGNWLVIRADRDQSEESSKDGWVRRERRTASVYRRFALPEQTRVDAISATFANGELSVTVPRVAEPEARRIPVTTPAEPSVAASEPAQETGEAA